MEHEGKIEMFGRTGTVWVLPEDVPAWEREGYWVKAKMPVAQDAPGEAVPMDTRRGCPLDSEPDAEF
jgi:hypothetical protein